MTNKMLVSVLYREPKVLKGIRCFAVFDNYLVSVLYREPKVLKGYGHRRRGYCQVERFSALP